jgi:diguanylate cyclase (GGDEF)-like protein
MTQLVLERELPEALTQADNLPSLPAVAMEVLRLTSSEDSTIDDLASCVSRDPALAAKLLKLSNSALFSMGQEVTTLQRATMVLGLKTVKLMTLSFSLVADVPNSGTSGGFDFQQYWRRSIVRSVSSRALAQLVGSPLVDEAFLCGLLTHFGRLVLGRVLKDEYAEVTEEAGGWPTFELEEKRLGFSSADVCASLLQSWSLPEIIFLATSYSARDDELPDDAPENLAQLVKILRMSRLTEAILCDDEKGASLSALYAALGEYNNLSEAEVDAFLVGLETGISSTAEMLSVKLSGAGSHDEIMNNARLQMVNISLGTAVALKSANEERDQLAVEKKKLITRATTDALTGLPNRAAFDEFLAARVQARLGGGQTKALGIVMMDVDKFKTFNDTHGHAAGDEVLRKVGEVLAENTREGDLSARYGGEEFVLVAPQVNPFTLKTVAERLRAAIENAEVEFEGKTFKVTASFGGACIAEFESPDEATALVKLADSFLYRAKENGRNRCETYRNVRFPGR